MQQELVNLSVELAVQSSKRNAADGRGFVEYRNVNDTNYVESRALTSRIKFARDVNDFGDEIEDGAIDEGLRMHSKCGSMQAFADYERNGGDDKDAYIPTYSKANDVT